MTAQRHSVRMIAAKGETAWMGTVCALRISMVKTAGIRNALINAQKEASAITEFVYAKVAFMVQAVRGFPASITVMETEYAPKVVSASAKKGGSATTAPQKDVPTIALQMVCVMMGSAIAMKASLERTVI